MVLAMGREVPSPESGTLHANNLAHAMTAGSSDQSTQYAWLVGDRQPPSRSTSLEAAQTVVRRWAANEAFSRGPVATANEVVGKAQEWDSPGRMVGDEPRARASRDASAVALSFVRAQRARSGGPKQPSGPSMFAQQVQTSEQANAQAASGTNAASGQGSAPAQARASQGLSPLMEFVAYEARRQVRLGKREFRVQLNPEHLGSVELEVVLEGNELIVRMKAASETAQQVLEENIEQLARSLAEQGMTLDVEIPWRAEKRHEALSPSVAGGPGLQATAAQK